MSTDGSLVIKEKSLFFFNNNDDGYVWNYFAQYIVTIYILFLWVESENSHKSVYCHIKLIHTCTNWYHKTIIFFSVVHICDKLMLCIIYMADSSSFNFSVCHSTLQQQQGKTLAIDDDLTMRDNKMYNRLFAIESLRGVWKKFPSANSCQYAVVHINKKLLSNYFVVTVQKSNSNASFFLISCWSISTWFHFMYAYFILSFLFRCCLHVQSHIPSDCVFASEK